MGAPFSQFGVTRKVNIGSGRRMRQSAHRNNVDAGLGVVTNRFQSDSAGRFQRNPSAATANGIPCLFHGEVIQKDDIGAGLDRILHALRVRHLHFDLHRGPRVPASVPDSGGDRVVKGQMIVLDQDGVEQTHPVIRAAATGHGVLVEWSQSRGGFPRVRYSGFRAAQALNILSRVCRDPAHTLQHIQRDPFASQD